MNLIKIKMLFLLQSVLLIISAAVCVLHYNHPVLDTCLNIFEADGKQFCWMITLFQMLISGETLDLDLLH